MYAGSGDREARLTPLASTVLSRARGLGNADPLPRTPIPAQLKSSKPARWLRLDQRFRKPSDVTISPWVLVGFSVQSMVTLLWKF